MNIMPCRYESLKHVLAGYAQTGIDLIGYDGYSIFPADTSDDIGLYYIVPKIARLFHLTLDQAISLFFYTLVGVSFGLAVIGFFLLSRSWLFRVMATVWLAFFSWFSCHNLTDVYLVSSSVVLALVPLGLFFLRTNKQSLIFFVFLFLSGISVGYAHYLRTFSSVAILLFLLPGIFFMMRSAWQKKLIALVVLCLGLSVPIVHFDALIKKRTQFFGVQENKSSGRHVFWHSVYAGFGFLNNELGIRWDDASVIEKARQLNSEAVYPTKQYESIVRGLVVNLIKQHPMFVFQTLFAKLGVIFFYFLLFANIGVFVAFFYKKPWILELMLLSGVAFNALFGVLALPGSFYLMGMLACAVVYGLVSVEYALKQQSLYKN